MEEIMVKFENVSKTYTDVKALNQVSFKVPKGSIMGYIGPNGAGKSTSMKILVGLIKDYSGSVQIASKDIKSSDHNPNLIGYLPQETGFQEWRTVDQVLRTFGKLSGIPNEKIDEKIKNVLELVALTDVESRKVVNLSGGMQQRLKIAQALLHEPELIIFDEPMNGLDPGSRFQVKNIIKDLKAKGKTVIFSSHILSDIQDIADSIGIIHQGTMLKLGSPEDLQNQFHVGTPIEVILGENGVMPKSIREIEGITEVQNSQTKATKYTIIVDLKVDIDQKIAEILKKMLAENCKIRKFHLVQPSLEEVYLKYVGGK